MTLKHKLLSYYKILPNIGEWASHDEFRKDGKLVPKDFTYSSDSNTEWMTVAELRSWIESNRANIGKI